MTDANHLMTKITLTIDYVRVGETFGALLFGLPPEFHTTYLFLPGDAREQVFPNQTPPVVEVTSSNQETLGAAVRVYQEAIDAHNLRIDTRKSLRTRLLAEAIIGQLEPPEVFISYSGYGDSGAVDECTPLENEELQGALEDFLWDILWTHHAGFENNEGAQGDVTWNLTDDQITINHGENVIQIAETVTVI